MIRRKLTLKRIDPWSVLKFGFVINLALLGVALLGSWILWVVIGRLGLIGKFCDSLGSIVLDLQDCGINGGPLFRTLILVGLLSVVVQTGIMVFGAFLYNLIADLTGGLAFSFLDESGDLQLTTARKAATSQATPSTPESKEPEPRRTPVGSTGSRARSSDWSARSEPASTRSSTDDQTRPAPPPPPRSETSAPEDEPIFGRREDRPSGDRTP